MISLNPISRRVFLGFAVSAGAALAFQFGNSFCDYAYGSPQLQNASRAYKFEGSVLLWRHVPILQFEGFLESAINGIEYKARLQIHKPDGSQVFYDQKSEGKVVQGRLKPDKSEIMRDYPKRHDKNVYTFDYSGGVLTSIQRDEENYAEKAKKPHSRPVSKRHNQSTDILTAIIQTLADIQDKKRPEELYIIGISGTPRLSQVIMDKNKVIIKAMEKVKGGLPFGSAEVDLDENLEPRRISLKDLSLSSSLPIKMDLEGRVKD